MASETTSADEVRYSGLETKGMRKVFCSMLLPESRDITCGVGLLKPTKVTVNIDYGAPNFSVDFPGAGVILLTVKDKDNVTGKGKILAVAGRCKYTPACHKDFKIMMRTKKEGKASGLGKNSEFKWPDVESFGLCPVCATRIQPSKKKECYMLFHLIFQQASKSKGEAIIGTRLQCQLCCLSCLEGLVKDKTLMGSDKSVMDVIAEMPGMPLLVGDNYQGYNKEGSTVSPAWQLYLKWEHKGVFQALAEYTRGLLSGLFGEAKKRADANAKTCLTCKTTLLPETASVCSRCKKATYCSRECQRQDWKRHKIIDCVDRTVKPEVHVTASLGVRPVCEMCNAVDIDKGPMIMCLCCGRMQLCHVCAREKGLEVITCAMICPACEKDYKRDLGFVPHQPAVLLQALLKARSPNDPQVSLARLMMAQCKLVDAQDVTGCRQDIGFAKREYLALADAGYGMAQHALASLYMHNVENASGVYFGPLHFVPPPEEADMPFEIDHKKAKHYLLLAVQSDNPVAVIDVAYMYKDGSGLFATNKPLALELFLKSANAGDPRGMSNVGQMLYRGDGVPTDSLGGVKWYRKAAEQDWEPAKAMLFQIGLSGEGFVSRDEVDRYGVELQECGFFETRAGKQIVQLVERH